MKITLKKTVGIASAALAATLLVACGSTDMSNPDNIKTLSEKDAQTELTSYVKKINPKTATPKKDIDSSALSDEAELPPIEKTYPLSVEGENQIDVEIFVSPEKAGSGKDGLFNDLANEFNAKNNKIDNKTVSVSIRPMPSGTGLDYISTNNHIPDGFSPSNTQWGAMLTASGTKLNTIAERTIGNTGGLLMKKNLHEEIKTKYNTVDMNALVKSVMDDGKLLGYTNPYTSSTGLSLLTQLLYHFDSENPLSDSAIEQLQKFQADLPSTFVNTPQLREVAKNGSVDIMSISYQTYINSPEFTQYTYVPMGTRHDSPIYTFKNTKPEKDQVVKAFTEFVLSDKSQEKASDYGFNQLNDYAFENNTDDGSMLYSIQHAWKENKNGGKPIVAVFVADTSGSMDGEPINSLRKSLLNSSKYIGDDAQIGLVSYNSDVTIEIPINPMDATQRSYFTGAVKNLQANGGTHTYSAALVALDMIQEQMKKTPDARPIIFILSDGESNDKYGFDNVAPIIKASGISINTIGYNEDLDELKKLSNINESASINANSEDVAYQLKQLFNAEL